MLGPNFIQFQMAYLFVDPWEYIDVAVNSGGLDSSAFLQIQNILRILGKTNPAK